MSSELIVSNPVELAEPFSSMVLEDLNLVHGRIESRILASLDGMADDLDMHGKYYLESNHAFAVPCSFEADDDVDYIAYNDGVMMSGIFFTFSVLKIGSILGAENSVRSLCLSFDETFLITQESPVPESCFLHVPVLSVGSISRDMS